MGTVMERIGRDAYAPESRAVGVHEDDEFGWLWIELGSLPVDGRASSTSSSYGGRFVRAVALSLHAD